MLFPLGSAERADLAGNEVDFDGALRREVAEETGIAPQTLKAEDCWHVVRAEPRRRRFIAMRGLGIDPTDRNREKISDRRHHDIDRPPRQHV